MAQRQVKDATDTAYNIAWVENTGTTTDSAALPVAFTTEGKLQLSNLATALAAGATTIAKAEDAASATGHVGVPMLAVRQATPANTSDADGDYEFVRINGGRVLISAILENAAIKQGAYEAIGSALTTELNAIANNANTAASAAIDNSTLRHKFMDLELVLAAQGVARSAGATLPVYLTPRIDGTNFADANEDCAILAGSFGLDAATTARRCALTNIPVPPEQFKLFVRNRTGQTTAASASTLKYRLHSDALA